MLVRALAAISLSSSVALCQLPYLELELASSPPGTAAPLEPTAVFGSLAAGVDAGWAATNRTTDATGRLIGGIWGTRTGAPNDPPGLLLTGSFGPPFDQDFLRYPYLSGGAVSYVAIDGTGLQQGAFLEGVPLAVTGDPVGTTGATWQSFFGVWHFPDGRNWVIGVPSQLNDRVVLEQPTDRVVLRFGTPIVDEPGPMEVYFDFAPDPSGDHWVANGLFRVPGTGFVGGLVVDGAVLDLGGGRLALEGEPLPPTIDSSPDVRWTFLRSPQINEAGDIAFVGTWGPPTDRFQNSAVIRNGVPVRTFDVDDPVNLAPVGIDAAGFLVTTEGTPPPFNGVSAVASVDDVPLTRPFQGIDVDGDGAVDPQWSVPLQTTSLTSVAVTGEGTVYVRSALSGPGEDVSAILRYSLAPERALVCSGEPNSRGLSGRLRAIGSTDVTFNELRLTASALPQFSAGMFLCSRTTGFVANPGGSAGNVCLGGAIGRFLTQTFATGATGSATIRVFLNVLPQPGGTVAALAGETWHFQAWHRDESPFGPTSNFTDAISVSLR
ncbi:MAG: hypothetical protein AAGI22_16085 [Planctomycetota bacterium]